MASCQLHEPSHHFLGQQWVLRWRLLVTCLLVLCAPTWVGSDCTFRCFYAVSSLGDAQWGAGTGWSLSSLPTQAVLRRWARCWSFDGCLSNGSFCDGPFCGGCTMFRCSVVIQLHAEPYVGLSIRLAASFRFNAVNDSSFRCPFHDGQSTDVLEPGACSCLDEGSTTSPECKAAPRCPHPSLLPAAFDLSRAVEWPCW